MTVCASPFLLDYAHLMRWSLTHGTVDDVRCRGRSASMAAFSQVHSRWEAQIQGV